ncbi:MAG: hypothetical protein R2716_12865 [Microthrixaceae bacterium]
MSAPAGYGKSTLVSSWADGRSTPTGWFQCDPADNDPARFWQYLVAALTEAAPGLASPWGPPCRLHAGSGAAAREGS